jgi:transposase
MPIRPQLEQAAGIDIHKTKITVCFYHSGQAVKVMDYGTFTEDLEQIRDDLQKEKIKDIIMESTGIYWCALCSLLMSAGIRVQVVNARFVKNMPKEKTDKKDACWLCKLLVNGQVRNSFIVTEQQRAFRDLCRMRTKYIHHITQSKNRILWNLERRNIKLRSVVSNMNTLSAREIVKALAAGETDMDKLVSLCRGKLRKKQEQMRKALVGVITQHDRDMLQGNLDDIAHYEEQIKKLEEKIKWHTDKVNQQLIEDLKEVPGIAQQSVEVILAEVGENVKPFASADKLAAWTGVAPGNNESNDKKKHVSTREGNRYLRTILVQMAWSAVRKRNSYWRALFSHLIKHIPLKKAIIAIARKLLRVIYKVIKGTRKYTEYGADFFIQKSLNKGRSILVD